MAKYYKKVFVDRPWNRPNLTSNGVLGGDSFACISLTPIDSSTYDAWRLFNGLEGEDTWFSTSSQGAFVFYNPYPLKVESFEVVNYYASNNYSLNWYKGSIYGSNDNVNWDKLTDFINESHYGGGEHWVIPVNSTGYYKYHKVQILENVGYTPSKRTMAREMYITATQQVSSWAECTKEEYDQLPDDQRKIVTDIYSIFSIEKYYKKISKISLWTQPVFSDTVYTDENFEILTDLHTDPIQTYYVSDNNPSTILGVHKNAGSFSGANHWIQFATTNPLNVTNIKVTNRNRNAGANQAITTGSIKVSNDGKAWVDITTWSNNNYGLNASWNIPLFYEGFYKYIRLYITSGYSANSGNYICVAEIKLTATQQVSSWAECTKEEYDQLPDDDRKIDTKTYASYSNTTATLYKTLNSPEYTSETQAQEGVNGIKFSPSNLYGMTNLSSYIRISQNQKVVFELPDNLVRINYVHHKGYVIGQVMPPSNINQVDISDDGTNWTTVATYSMPTYGIGGDVTNQLDLPKIKYIRFNFWFHGSGSPSYYGSGGVGSVYINCLIREEGKEKSVNLYYLGGR